LISVLNVTKGYAARETIAAVNGAVKLAERSGDLNQLISFMTWRGSTLLVSGDLVGAGASYDRAGTCRGRRHCHPSCVHPSWAAYRVVFSWRSKRRRGALLCMVGSV